MQLNRASLFLKDSEISPTFGFIKDLDLANVLIGVLGNLLTLCAIPYAQHKKR